MKNTNIPKGSTDYYGKAALLRDYILNNISKIYSTYGFDSLYTPIIECSNIFDGYYGKGDDLLFKLKDKNQNEYVLKYDSTVPLARVVSMYEDIKLPYKRYQLQQSYRDNKVDKSHYREFIQCDGDIVGSTSLVDDSEFINIAYEGLTKLGFKDFTIRLNHRKLFQAIADVADIYDKETILEIQRTIDDVDKIIKKDSKRIEEELNKRNIDNKVIKIIMDLVNIGNFNYSLEETLLETKKYFKGNKFANEGIKELEEIVNYLSKPVKEKCKIDFVLSRNLDYYTGFVLEGNINNVELGAVLGGGRYDNLISSFSDKNIPAVGMAFEMEKLIIAMKELNLDKRVYNSISKKILLYVSSYKKKEAIQAANRLREKYDTSLVFDTDLSNEDLYEYCINSNITLVAKLSENNELEFFNLNDIQKQENKLKVKKIK